MPLNFANLQPSNKQRTKHDPEWWRMRSIRYTKRSKKRWETDNFNVGCDFDSRANNSRHECVIVGDNLMISSTKKKEILLQRVKILQGKMNSKFINFFKISKFNFHLKVFPLNVSHQFIISEFSQTQFSSLSLAYLLINDSVSMTTKLKSLIIIFFCILSKRELKHN